MAGIWPNPTGLTRLTKMVECIVIEKKMNKNSGKEFKTYATNQWRKVTKNGESTHFF
jgi:hypothetical protein